MPRKNSYEYEYILLDFDFRKYCGRNSPKFIYALQQLVQFSNEFIQDPSSIQLSQVRNSIF
jgi:hypothetical protein